MYTGVLYQNWIINFYRSIGWPIGPPSKLYDDNQAIIKRFLVEIINTQSRPLSVLITDLHELHVQKTFEMVDTRSKMQLSDLNSDPHVRKGLRDLIDRMIVVCFYPPPGSQYHKLLCLDKFHGYTHISETHRNNDETKLDCIMCSIKPARINYTQGYFNLLRSTNLITCKNTARLSNCFVRLWINQWMHIICLYT